MFEEFSFWKERQC